MPSTGIYSNEKGSYWTKITPEQWSLAKPTKHLSYNEQQTDHGLKCKLWLMPGRCARSFKGSRSNRSYDNHLIPLQQSSKCRRCFREAAAVIISLLSREVFSDSCWKWLVCFYLGSGFLCCGLNNWAQKDVSSIDKALCLGKLFKGVFLVCQEIFTEKLFTIRILHDFRRKEPFLNPVLDNECLGSYNDLLKFSNKSKAFHSRIWQRGLLAVLDCCKGFLLEAAGFQMYLLRDFSLIVWLIDHLFFEMYREIQSIPIDGSRNRFKAFPSSRWIGCMTTPFSLAPSKSSFHTSHRHSAW